VLVIDDVTTTGATLIAAARALRACGARDVVAATVARTPSPGSRTRDAAYTHHAV
jgi:predicted amidophosphoribosyltransferase